MEHGPSTSAILLFRFPKQLSADDKAMLRRFAGELSKRIAGGRTFTAVVSDDCELRDLNKRFLQNDYATDVLSFPTTDPASLGDLAISYQRAEAQAAEFGHAVRDELRLLMLHGVLHLTGYDHETDGGAMAAAEERWRAEFALPRPLTARAGATA